MKLLSCFVLAGWCNTAVAQKARRVAGVYRVLQESRGPMRVWIVDGGRVRAAIDSEFLYGGNQERYRYNPRGEIWIDNAISCEEYSYTLAHELLEERLMSKQGWSYSDAHDSALSLEHTMRLRDQVVSQRHEAELPMVPPVDDEGTKEIATIPDKVHLRNIYLQNFEDRDSMRIWIVDGAVVRRDIFPDFGFSGNDLAYRFIPKGEIWIDNAMGCEELEFSIRAEIRERELMASGADYYSAYTTSVKEMGIARRAKYNLAAQHPPVRVTRDLHRDIGTGLVPLQGTSHAQQ